MLNGRGENRYLCLDSDLSREAFSLFTTKYDIVVDFSEVPFIRLKVFSSISSLFFVKKNYWILSIAFSMITEIIMWFLSFILEYCVSVFIRL